MPVLVVAVLVTGVGVLVCVDASGVVDAVVSAVESTTTADVDVKAADVVLLPMLAAEVVDDDETVAHQQYSDPVVVAVLPGAAHVPPHHQLYTLSHRPAPHHQAT